MTRRTLTTEYRRGFTLIELLVVIAIIAVLSAILFPVFARVQAKAKQTSCLSNLKQINFAVLAYCSDYEGYGPYTWWPQICGAEVEQPWSCKLAEYGAPYYLYDPGSTKVTCDGTPYKVNPLWQCTSGLAVSSYDIPYYRGGYYCDASPTSTLIPWSLSQYDKQAAQTLLVGEAQPTMNPGYYRGVIGSRGWQTSFFAPKYPTPTRNEPKLPLHLDSYFGDSTAKLHPEWAAHNGGSNVGYMDGHVKWISQIEFARDFQLMWGSNGIWGTVGPQP